MTVPWHKLAVRGGHNHRQITSAFGTIRDTHFFNIYSTSTCPDEPRHSFNRKADTLGAKRNLLEIHAQPCNHAAKKYGGPVVEKGQDILVGPDDSTPFDVLQGLAVDGLVTGCRVRRVVWWFVGTEGVRPGICIDVAPENARHKFYLN